MKRAILFLFLMALPAVAQQHIVWADPCQSPSVKKQSAVISLATTTATAIVPSSAGKIVYVCGASFTLAGTSPTALWTSAATCGTSPTNLTGTYAPTAGTHLLIGYGSQVAFQNTSGQNLCLTLGGTSPSAQGVVTFAQL